MYNREIPHPIRWHLSNSTIQSHYSKMSSQLHILKSWGTIYICVNSVKCDPIVNHRALQLDRFLEKKVCDGENPTRNPWTRTIRHLGEHINPTTPLRIWLYTSQTYTCTFQTQNTQSVIHPRRRWFRYQVLHICRPGPLEQYPPSKIHDSNRHHWYTLLWTHPEMGLSTIMCRCFNVRICRQGPETILPTLSLETISLSTYSCRSFIQTKSPVYRSSRHITPSLLKWNHHSPINHRYPPLLCSSRRHHPIYRPWDTWISEEEANGKWCLVLKKKESQGTEQGCTSSYQNGNHPSQLLLHMLT